MLQSINPPFYRGQASQLLQIAYQHKDTMSSLALSYADEQDSAFALKLPIGPPSLEQVDARIEAISHRVQSRCQGLLEVYKFKACEEVPVIQTHLSDGMKYGIFTCPSVTIWRSRTYGATSWAGQLELSSTPTSHVRAAYYYESKRRPVTTGGDFTYGVCSIELSNSLAKQS